MAGPEPAGEEEPECWPVDDPPEGPPAPPGPISDEDIENAVLSFAGGGRT